MKKLIVTICLVIGLMNIGLTAYAALDGSEPVNTACTQPQNFLNPKCMLYRVGEGTGGQEGTNLPSFYETGQHPDAVANYLNPGAGTVTSPVLFIIDLIRFAMSTIAFIVIIVYAIRLISETNEDEYGKIRQGLVWGVLGLILIQLAAVIVKKMFFGDYGEAFEDQSAAEEFAGSTVSQTRGLIGFAQIFLGAVAVLVIIVRGVILMTSAGDEEAMTKAKKHIGYALVGLVVIGLSELIFRGIVFPDNGSELPSLKKAQSVIRMITNFASGFVAILSFAALFYAGYRYVASAGNEEETEKVKKIFIGAIIGILLAMGAFAIGSSLEKLDNNTDETAPVFGEPI